MLSILCGQTTSVSDKSRSRKQTTCGRECIARPAPASVCRSPHRRPAAARTGASPSRARSSR
eukprot:4472785-Pleurochrysis_carterae.AAC.1